MFLRCIYPSLRGYIANQIQPKSLHHRTTTKEKESLRVRELNYDDEVFPTGLFNYLQHTGAINQENLGDISAWLC